MALPAMLTLFVCPRCKDSSFKKIPRCDCIPSRTSRVPLRIKAEGKIKREVEDDA